MVLDTSLLNTQQYKVRIKGKVEQSRERSNHPPLHLGVVAIEKGNLLVALDYGCPTLLTTYYYCYYLTLMREMVKQRDTQGGIQRQKALLKGKLVITYRIVGVRSARKEIKWFVT